MFVQPDAARAHAQWRKVADGLRSRVPKLAALLDDAAEEVVAHLAFPRAHWRPIGSTNPRERLNKEVTRRTNVVGIVPNPAAVPRPGGAVRVEQQDDWWASRRSVRVASLAALATLPLPAEPTLLAAG